MARLRRGQGRAIVATLFLSALLPGALAPGTASAQPDASPYFDRPVLVVETGMHTNVITNADVDAAGRFVVTGSEDKTVRIWSVSDGSLLRTIRVPTGPGNIGKIYAVAISPG